MTASPLPDIARLGLDIGRLLLETGASADLVQRTIVDTTTALGCDTTEVFCQHAAIIIMLRRGDDTCVQMGKVGEHGVNLRRAEAVLAVTRRVANGQLLAAAAHTEILHAATTHGAYPLWLVSLATGLACAAFGRLLGADWPSFLPIALGAAIGQILRHHLLRRGHNLFLTVGLVAFTSALVATLGSRLLSSAHLDIASVAAVLLLVPGPAVLNAQMDALHGKPNLAAARLLRIFYILLFMTIGLVLAQRLAAL